MKKNAPRITRNSASTSANNGRSSSLVKHTTQCSKYSFTQNSTPFLRACGCAHRFVPNIQENKSPNTYKRRSRSCTPRQVNTHDTEVKTKLKSHGYVVVELISLKYSDSKFLEDAQVLSACHNDPYLNQLTYSDIKTEEGKNRKSENTTLIRHTSENNLYSKPSQTLETASTQNSVPQWCHRFRYEFNLQPQTTLRRYATTVHIDLNSSKKHYTEQISMKVCPRSHFQNEICNLDFTYTNTIEMTLKQTLSATTNGIYTVDSTTQIANK